MPSLVLTLGSRMGQRWYWPHKAHSPAGRQVRKIGQFNIKVHTISSVIEPKKKISGKAKSEI